MNTRDALEDFIIHNKPDGTLDEAHLEDLMTRIDESARVQAAEPAAAAPTVRAPQRKLVLGASAAALAIGIGVASAIVPGTQSPAQANPLHGVQVPLGTQETQQLEENCAQAPTESGQPLESGPLVLNHAEDRGTFLVGWFETTNGKKFTCLAQKAAEDALDTSLSPYVDYSPSRGAYTPGSIGVSLDDNAGTVAKKYTVQSNATDSSYSRYEATLLDGTKISGTVFDGQFLIVSEEGKDIEFTSELTNDDLVLEVDYEATNLAQLELFKDDGTSDVVTP